MKHFCVHFLIYEWKIVIGKESSRLVTVQCAHARRFNWNSGSVPIGEEVFRRRTDSKLWILYESWPSSSECRPTVRSRFEVIPRKHCNITYHRTSTFAVCWFVFLRDRWRYVEKSALPITTKSVNHQTTVTATVTDSFFEATPQHRRPSMDVHTNVTGSVLSYGPRRACHPGEGGSHIIALARLLLTGMTLMVTVW